MDTFSVHGAPSEYVIQEVLWILRDKLFERGLMKVLFVHGSKSWEAAKAFLPVLMSFICEQCTYMGNAH